MRCWWHCTQMHVHIRAHTHTYPNVYPCAGDDRPFDLLKLGCAIAEGPKMDRACTCRKARQGPRYRSGALAPLWSPPLVAPAQRISYCLMFACAILKGGSVFLRTLPALQKRIGRREKTPTNDPRPLYYKTPPCAFYHKNVRSRGRFGP